jgi:plastocyanin
MRRMLSGMATVLLIAAAGAGCGDGGSGLDQDQVLTTLEVSPATAALFTVAPGNTVTLTLIAKDQRGETMTGVGSPTFSSGNSAVATVSDDGTITATGAGTTEVTASLTAGGVTATGTTTVSAQVTPATATVTAPSFAYQPQVVDVTAAGTVTWSFGAIHHDVTFTTAGAPANVPELRNGSAARAFPDPGTFAYRCSFHPGMTGTVRVH